MGSPVAGLTPFRAAMAYFKGPEANKGYLLAVGQGIADGCERCLDGLTCYLLGQVSLYQQPLRPGHSYSNQKPPQLDFQVDYIR